MKHTTMLRAAPLALALLLGSAFTGYARADPPDTVQPPECPKLVEDHYFCCEWVDPTGNGGAGTGGGCVKTTEDNLNGCSNWLACPGGATSSEGTVTCTTPKK